MVKKKESEEIKEFLKGLVFNKKFQWTVVLVLFLAVLISSTSIRLSNVETLKSSVTGEYLSNDLDSMLFYRQAETRMNLGYWPEYDEMRSPGYNTPWIKELINYALIWNYKILNFFDSDITFNYASTISAPLWYAIGLILFFILSYLLTKSKVASLIASAFLAYAPGFLFRSIAGFYDHDHLGVFTIFAVMIVAVLSFRYFEKSYKNSIIWGIALGFFTALMLYSWGGGITFLLVFLPVAFLLHYLFNVEDKNKFLMFYAIWFIASILFTPLLGMNANHMYGRFLDSQGILVLFVLGFALVDSLVDRFKDKLNFLNKKYLHGYSLGATIILGTIGLFAIGKNPLNLIQKAWATLIYPFFGEFGGRLSATVAENAQPYLTDLINQNTSLSFWFFLLGLLFISINFTCNSKKIVNRLILSGGISFMFFAILFSRYSGASLLNGENIISQGLYLLGGIGFLVSLGYVYSKEKFKISIETILLFSMALTVALNARAAIRSFFLITPFICLIGAYGIIEIVKRTKSVKEESFKPIIWIIVLLICTMTYVSLFGVPFGSNPGKYQIVSQQAKHVGPSANLQWQNAMAWASNETPEKSIFVHWWDYGYFVQTMGKRPTVTDGGHSGGDHADHYIGRYILTTPKPETAVSFMKTWNVSYLLIDPTEMGKYGAFSKIGSNDSWDRISAGIFGGASDDSQTQETATGITKVYQLGGCVDQDIAYNKTFLPGLSISKTQQMQCNSYVGGVVIEFVENNGQSSIKQPIGVFFYNNKQYRIPIKNVYFNGRMQSFENGIDSVAYLIPEINQNSGQMDLTGAMIYLSPRTHNSLMGRLYILNDYYKEYPTLKEARFEEDPVVAYFGGQMNEFVWYGGLRAPLKIWEVNYPAGTPIHEDFLDRTSKLVFGGLDYLFE
jgi:asparagine N-glycosylation enzyme membrane subunit Stt3